MAAVRAGPSSAVKPFVVLWGWLGSQDRHLGKYVNMWRALGAQPHSMRISSWDVVPPRHERAQTMLLDRAVDLVDAYRQHCATTSPSAPVFVHSFSNAGYLAWGSLQSYAAWAHGFPTTHLLQPRNRFAREDLQTLGAVWRLMKATRGSIIDSAPSQHTPEIWTRGIETAIKGSGGFLAPLQVAAFHLFYKRSLVDHLKDGSYREFLEEAMAGWREASPSPRLYLYSHADTIIPSEDVEAAIAADKARALDVSAICFEGSDHVAHYKAHPEEYAHACTEFVNRCLARSPQDLQAQRVDRLRQEHGIFVKHPRR